MTDTIKVARYRNFPYTVNYTVNGGIKTYQWAGSRGDKTDIKEVPTEVVDWLLMTSGCFRDGELKIIEDTEEAKVIASNIDDPESYKNNTHTRAELVKILEGNFMKMKSELGKITVQSEKQYVLDVAKEIKLDANSKLKFIAEWIGAPVDVLFDE
ncbi:hypothetical protein ACH6EH_06650 [Paenibacillus sp. JSM ZJ436]|uniref:hypothetical protein n=1 Tax=Paenibacillus sp. JSM ZJ436 TaxID=3376190 RepID=UPI0037B625DD